MGAKLGYKIKSCLMVSWGRRRPPLYVGIYAGPVGCRYPSLLIVPSEGILKNLGGPHIPVIIACRDNR